MSVSTFAISLALTLLSLPHFIRWVHPPELEACILKDPVYRAIATYDSAAYAEIREQIFAHYGHAGDCKGGASEVQSLVHDFIRERVGRSTDTAVLVYVDAMLLEMAALRDHDAVACYDVVVKNADVAKRSADFVLSDEIQGMKSQGIRAIIESSFLSEQPPPDESVVKQLLLNQTKQFEESHEQFLSQIDGHTVGPHDKKIRCELALQFFSELRQLPDVQSGAIYRYLLSHRPKSS
jgi:hypothetical protein